VPEATLLLVDDNPINLAVLRKLLEGDGRYALLEAVDAASALALVEATPDLDLILLDVNLPDRCGIEVCRQLKGARHTEHIRIVLVSAISTDDKSIAEGLNAGADGYLTQPIEPTALRAWVGAALRIRRLERALSDNGAIPLCDEVDLLRHFSRLSHAVNNPLQSLIATADLLGMDLEGDVAAMEALDTVLELADRVARVVGEASRLAKRHMAEFE
jgi:CheY-like chemotaxis protein